MRGKAKEVLKVIKSFCIKPIFFASIIKVTFIFSNIIETYVYGESKKITNVMQTVNMRIAFFSRRKKKLGKTVRR